MSNTLWITILLGLSAIVLAFVGLIQHNKLLTYGCVVVALACLFVVVILQKQEEYEQRGNDAKWMGILEPGSKYPLIPKECGGHELDSDSAVLALGHNSGAIVHGKQETLVLSVSGQSYLAFKISNGQIALNAKISDSSGKEILFVKDNNFRIDPSKVTRDLAPNDSELSVFDLQNRLVFRVDFRNSLNMYFIGTLSSQYGQMPITVTDKGTRQGGMDFSSFCLDGTKFGFIS